MVYLVLALAGLACGSFVNALVWRLHEQTKKKNKARPDLSITKGRSMCVHCHHILGAMDLVPVVSWLALQGKCRYCKHPISWQYPLVELLTALLFVTSYLVVSSNSFTTYQVTGAGVGAFVAWLTIVTGLVALAVYDIRWMLLPNRIVFPLTGVAAVYVLLVGLQGGNMGMTVAQALLAVAVSFGPFYALHWFSDGRLIGGGDVKLCIVLGLVAGGAVPMLLLLFLASLMGCIVALPGLLTGKIARTSRVPFGPFLIAATFIIVLYGSSIISRYEQFVLGI